MTRLSVLIICLYSVFAIADYPSLPPTTEVSKREAEALGFEIELTQDFSYDCVFAIRAAAPESIGALSVRFIGGGLLDGNEPLFLPTSMTDASDYHALVSGKFLHQFVIAAGYIGDGTGTVYRVRFKNADGQCR